MPGLISGNEILFYKRCLGGSDGYAHGRRHCRCLFTPIPPWKRRCRFHVIVCRSTRAPLTEAMKEFGLQTHLQVAHFSDVGAATLQVGPIVGTYTPEEALRLMLSGTGLTYRFVNPRTVAIVRETPSSNAAAAPPPAGDDVSKTPSDEFAGSPVAQNAPPPEQRENAPPRRGIIARLLGLFAACSAAALAANPACAQSTAPSSTAAPAGANATELVEIIVTAPATLGKSAGCAHRHQRAIGR